MLSSRIVCLLTVFDACGFYSGSTFLSKRQKYIYLVYFVHFSMVLFLTLYFCHLIIHFFPKLGVTESISEFLQYSIGLVTYWLIIFDSFFHRHTHRKFYEILEQIYNRFYKSKSTLQSYVIKIVEYFFITLSIVVIRLAINNFVDTVIDFAYTVLFKICQLRIFYYIFCLEIVHSQLKAIEFELKKMQGPIIAMNNTIMSRPSKISLVRFFELYRLQLIRKHYDCVSQMIGNLNTIFGWSNVASISYCFYLFLTDMNWFYIHHHELSYAYYIGISFCNILTIYFVQYFHVCSL